MNIYRVPILNDYPEYRNNFIKSTSTGGVAFLSEDGRMFLMNEKIQRAVEQLFDGAAQMRKELDYFRGLRPPTLPPPAERPVPVRGLVSIEAYVNSVERLAKAFR